MELDITTNFDIGLIYVSSQHRMLCVETFREVRDNIHTPSLTYEIFELLLAQNGRKTCPSVLIFHSRHNWFRVESRIKLPTTLILVRVCPLSGFEVFRTVFIY